MAWSHIPNGMIHDEWSNILFSKNLYLELSCWFNIIHLEFHLYAKNNIMIDTHYYYYYDYYYYDYDYDLFDSFHSTTKAIICLTQVEDLPPHREFFLKLPCILNKSNTCFLIFQLISIMKFM